MITLRRKQKVHADHRNLDSPKPENTDVKFITAFCDASWSPKTNCFGAGIWVKGENYTYRGGIAGEESNPEKAELRGLEETIRLISLLPITGSTIIVIQCDCLGALNKADIKPLIKLKPLRIKLKHVKAHTSINSSRTAVNRWCDEEASKRRIQYESKFS